MRLGGWGGGVRRGHGRPPPLSVEPLMAAASMVAAAGAADDGRSGNGSNGSGRGGGGGGGVGPARHAEQGPPAVVPRTSGRGSQRWRGASGRRGHGGQAIPALLPRRLLPACRWGGLAPGNTAQGKCSYRTPLGGAPPPPLSPAPMAAVRSATLVLRAAVPTTGRTGAPPTRTARVAKVRAPELFSLWLFSPPRARRGGGGGPPILSCLLRSLPWARIAVKKAAIEDGGRRKEGGGANSHIGRGTPDERPCGRENGDTPRGATEGGGGGGGGTCSHGTAGNHVADRRRRLASPRARPVAVEKTTDLP